MPVVLSAFSSFFGSAAVMFEIFEFFQEILNSKNGHDGA
jgi:hypothetical protein